MKLLFGGDYHVNRDGACDLEALAPRIASADRFVVNLEGPLLDEAALSPIAKRGPNLSMRPDALAPLSAFGPRMLVCGANNHIGDHGPRGVAKTMELLRANGIEFTGMGDNCSDASQPCLLGDNVALLAVAENEFGMAGDAAAGANGLRPERNLIEIMRLAQEGRKVVVYYHGGNEECPVPNPFVRRLFRSFVDAGACAVIGNHTHCPQGFETYGGALIVYSTGNFLFPRRETRYGPLQRFKLRLKRWLGRTSPRDFWELGYLVELDLDGDALRYRIVPHGQHAGCAVVPGAADAERFMTYLAQLNAILDDEARWLDLWHRWTYRQSAMFQGRISRFSYRRLTRRYSDFLALRNLFTCESHRELVLNMNALIEAETLERYQDLSELEALRDPERAGL